MKIHLAWIRITAGAAAMIVTSTGLVALGAGPFTGASQNSNVPAYSVPPTQQTQPPVYSTTPPQAYAPAVAGRYATTQQPVYTAQLPYGVRPQQQASQYQPPVYQAARQTYPSVARQQNGAVMPGATPVLPPQTEPLPTPAPAANGMSGEVMPQSYDASGHANGSNGHASSPYPSTDGYYGSDPGNGAACGGQDYDMGGYRENCAGGGQWFGGVYGLYMQRTNPSDRRLTVGVDTTAYPYYPLADTTENHLDCSFLDYEYEPGFEVRLGCSFDLGNNCNYGSDCGNGYGCDSGCAPCCPQPTFAWEAAYWSLEQGRYQQFVDGPVVGNFRYYGMVNYAGLSYDYDVSGTYDAGETVNEFYNYQLPIVSLGTYTVLSQRVRTYFDAENLELNFLRLPIYCSGGCNYGCDPCGYDACAPAVCEPAFTITGLCGLRYFHIEEGFGFDSEWATATQTTFDGWGNSTNELWHDIDMENDLTGFQLGANMNYCVSCKWNVFWDSNFGLYNNHISHYQRIYNPTDNAPTRFVQENRDATVQSSKDQVSFLGEMRLGGAYNISCNWRATLAYRAVAMTGLALATDQIRPEYSNWTDTARIDADGSMVIHGVQAGVECCY